MALLVVEDESLLLGESGEGFGKGFDEIRDDQCPDLGRELVE
jgi:hypothetical protein